MKEYISLQGKENSRSDNIQLTEDWVHIVQEFSWLHSDYGVIEMKAYQENMMKFIEEQVQSCPTDFKKACENHSPLQRFYAKFWSNKSQNAEECEATVMFEKLNLK